VLSYSAHHVVTFSDCDPAGIIFYPRAMTLAHDAVEAMIAGSSIGRDAWFASSHHAAPLRRAELDFFHPLRPGDKISLHARVEKVGRTSVTFVVDFVGPSDRRVASAQSVHVLLDQTTGHPTELTPAMREAFAGKI
jgi:acyl-CoA thioesterase FadM